MITYLDTSGFIPLVIREPGSDVAAKVWTQSESLVSGRLLIVEASAALAMAFRLGRITAAEFDSVLDSARLLWSELYLVDAAAHVIDNAAQLTRDLSLRGYDAMHLATAELIRGDDVLFVSGDRVLLAAAKSRGLHTLDTAAGEPTG